ncbi:UNVERIFIED_CONTAM: Chaperone protein dnaJ 11, chloroplastic [Sesamum calycinum]|uniref:Chaperone protein dnaJ 11, chloroplastic n=1 Tax=Sesamum calycinum TaxID=2727403 RepID=A0AAW2P874_9LAMI
MASTSFALPNHKLGRKFSAIPPPHSPLLRVSASYATAEDLHVAPKYGDDGASSADEFMRVHAAYATLSDPDKRAVYDKSLFLRRRSAAAFSASGYSEVNRRRRTWETDQCW